MHSHARQLTHRLDLLRSTSKSSGKLTSGARALGVKTSLFIHQNPVRSVSTRQSMNSSQRTNKKGRSYTRASCWTLESRRRLFHSKKLLFWHSVTTDRNKCGGCPFSNVGQRGNNDPSRSDTNKRRQRERGRKERNRTMKHGTLLDVRRQKWDKTHRVDEKSMSEKQSLVSSSE